jgi:ABC-2 type transport system permease protein
MNRLLAIAWKELIQLRRDRLTAAMVFGIPIIQLLLFGYAINMDVRHLPTIVFDQDHTTRSRDITQSLATTGYYDLVGEVQSYDDAAKALRSGVARVALVIPAGYSEDLSAQRPSAIQVIVDGSDPQTVASATATASGLATSMSLQMTFAKLAASGAQAALPVTVESSVWYNPDLKTSIFIVPGIVGVILTMTMVMFTAMAIARERERGTLEQLIVSPVRRYELILGKILPYVLIGYFQMSLILGLGHVVFGVPIVGDLWLLYALSSLFISGNLALGITFSTVAATQQQAMQMSFFFLLPNILLSGFMFPIEGMPVPAQFASQLLPLTHFLKVIRGIILKGANFSELQGELIWLASILLVLLVIASLRFRKKLA